MLYHRIYENSNSTEWVVFVHGAGGSSEIWFKQIKPYTQEFNVLLIDLRGHGKTEVIEEVNAKREYSFKSVTAEIIEVLDFKNIPQAHFVGVSLGTILIRQIAEDAPERIKSIVYTGAITWMNIKSRVVIFFGHRFKSILPTMVLYKIYAYIIMPRKNHVISRSVFIQEAKKVCRNEFLRWFNLTAVLVAKLRSFEKKDIEIPTLYIMGQEDHMFLRSVQELVKKSKCASLFIVEKCGHVVNIDSPQIFNKTSIEFIKKQSSKMEFATSENKAIIDKA